MADPPRVPVVLSPQLVSRQARCRGIFAAAAGGGADLLVTHCDEKLDEAPSDIVMNPSGSHVYVSSPTSVHILQTDTNTLVEQIATCADELAINQARAELYTLCHATGEISVVNLDTETVAPVKGGGGVAAVAVGPEGFLHVAHSGASSMVVVDPAHHRVYTANENGTISLVDTTTNTFEKVPIRWSG